MRSASASTSGYQASQSALTAASTLSTLSTRVVEDCQQARRRADCLAAAQRRTSLAQSSFASAPTPSASVSSSSSNATASAGAAAAAGVEPAYMTIASESIGNQPTQSATSPSVAAASTSQPAAARTTSDAADNLDGMDTDDDDETGTEAATASHLPTALLQLLQEYRPPPHNGTAWAACVVHAALLDCALQPVALPGAGVGGLEAALAAAAASSVSQHAFACRQGYMLPGLPAREGRPATLPAVAQVRMYRMGAFLVVLGAECSAEGGY